MKNKIIAGIVTYNPNIDRLRENIRSIICQVHKLIIIDNNSLNKSEIYLLGKEYDFDIIKNKENYGISNALNQILNYAKINGYEWIISLDQDSVVDLYLVKKYSSFFDMPQVAMLTCNIKDRNSTLKTKAYTEPYCFVSECITSGCCANTNILSKLGGYDNNLFIDAVDLEMCYRIISNGYKIIKINYDGLLHELGYITNLNFGTRILSIFNENAFRNYYISRNLLYCFFKTKNFHFIVNLLKHIFKIIFYENDKCNKISFICKGIKDAFLGNMGKLERKYK